MPQLSDLVRAVPEATLFATCDADVRDITWDSRRVQPGDLFVALSGQRTHGTHFVEDAIHRGAAGVISECYLPGLPASCALVLVPSARRALSRLAAALHGFPARRLKTIGITGTDGKTTTSHMTAATLTAAGEATGLITTTHVGIYGQTLRNPHGYTTPEAPDIQKSLREMAESGLAYAVIETSSHALAQHRVDDCYFRAAAVTNLSPEHLNYHGSLDSYRRDKGRLLQLLVCEDDVTPGIAVLNCDDPHYPFFQAQAPGKALTFSLHNRRADFRAMGINETISGTTARIITPVGSIPFQTKMLGSFNIKNWLVAAALVYALGRDPLAIVTAAETFTGVPGRLQRIEAGQPFDVFVDFAHTPQGLETVLRLLRRLVPGRILLTFGNAGNRDQANRPAMGRIAAELADFWVCTSDDTEDEDPHRITEHTVSGARAAGARLGRDYMVELDRQRAIELLMDRARPGDVVLIAGRGHETILDLGKVKLPFEDAAVAHAILQSRYHVPIATTSQPGTRVPASHLSSATGPADLSVK